MVIMLVPSLIWTIVVFSCVAARPKSYGNAFDVQKANAMQKKMEISRKGRHLQMNLETSEAIGKVSGDILIREKRNYEMHDWLTQEQKQEIRAMESEGLPRSEIVTRILGFFSKLLSEEKDKWNEVYKKQCIEWIGTVANDSEIAELEALRSKKNVKEYEAKLSEYKSRLSESEQDQINLWQDGCNKLNSLDIQQGTHHMMSRRDLSQNKENAYLLSNEQIALLDDMRASGASEEDIKRKLEQYYSAFPEHKRKEVDHQFKAKCIQWIQDVASFHEIQLFINSFERRNRLVFNILLDEYFDRLPKKQQNKEQYTKDICREMWREAMNSNRRKRYVDEKYNEWILWMTDEQKQELQQMRDNGSSFDEIHKKVNGHFLKLPETMQEELINDYKKKCRKYFVALASKDEIEKLQAVHDETNHLEHEKIINEILHRQPQNVRDKAYKFYQICDDVYHKQSNRSKRDIDHLMEKHLRWLTPEQKAEIRQMKASGESLSSIKQKLFSYIAVMGTDEQLHTVEKTKQSCYAWLENVTSVEERIELENLHHTDHSACKWKVREYIKRLSPQKQQEVNKDLEICEHIWYNQGNHGSGHEHHHHQHRGTRLLHPQIYTETNSRSKRDNHEHSLDDYFRTHLSWLTDAQKDEIRKMKEEGKQKMDMQKKILDYYENLTGDGKKEAGEKLRGGCRELLRQIVGDEKMAELKQMKESGLGQEELRAKVDEMLEHVTDEAKKQKIHEYGPACRIIFEMPGLLRNKREQVNDNIMQHSGVYLQWLTDEEKDEIGKATGRSRSGAEILKAIFSYYQNLHGKEKEIAGERLKLVCEEVIRSLVYENRLSELQALEDNDSAVSEMMKMLSATIDKSKFIQIRAYQTACNRIFDSGQIVRTKREQKNHSLDDYVEMNLKWLSMDQKEELREMKRNGKSRADMIAKVFHYYDELLGEAKEYVSELLKDGCRQILKEVIGEDRYNELAKLRNSGANMNDLKGKADAMLIEITDVEKKEKIKIYGSGCKRILATADHKHSLEDHFKTDLKWLTKEQKDEILRIKEENKSKVDIRGKILHFYKSLNEETKKERAEFLSGVCDEMIAHVFGEEKAAELKELRKSTSAVDEIKRRMDVLIERIEDDEMKAKAREYGSICRKIFVDNQYKQNEHSMTHYFRTHLKWLSGEQKEEIKQMKANGKSREEIQSKIFEFFESASGETKKYATESLMEGCYELFKMIGGEEKADELHVMIQSDLAAKKIEEKITSIIDSIDNESKKAYAKAYLTPCMHLHNIRMTRQKRGNVIATVK